MDVTSMRTPGLGDQSYLLTHEGRGILVDPQRDIGRFLAVAVEKDVDLRFVLETHLHNDYVSGGEQAAMRTGAELVMPAAAAPAYRHTPALHNEDIDAGRGLTIRPLHTPEHTSYVVLIDGEQVAVFSGGSLLVGSAGHSDVEGTATQLAQIGVDTVAGVVRGLPAAAATAGYELVDLDRFVERATIAATVLANAGHRVVALDRAGVADVVRARIPQAARAARPAPTEPIPNP